MIDLFQKHRLGPDPEPAVAIELAVDHIFLSGLRMAGYILHQIAVSLKVPIDPFELQFLHSDHLGLHYTARNRKKQGGQNMKILLEFFRSLW